MCDRLNNPANSTYCHIQAKRATWGPANPHRSKELISSSHHSSPYDHTTLLASTPYGIEEELNKAELKKLKDKHAGLRSFRTGHKRAGEAIATKVVLNGPSEAFQEAEREFQQKKIKENLRIHNEMLLAKRKEAQRKRKLKEKEDF